MKQTISKNRNRLLCLLGMLSILLVLPVVAMPNTEYQGASPITVSGVVSDQNNQPLIGVTITLKGVRSGGTVTDVSGKFKINVPKSTETLVISYVGYNTIEVPVNNRTVVNIKMEEDTQAIDDVVVVGYGVQKKVTVTGSVSTIETKELLKAPSSNLGLAMSGKLPGLSTVQRAGTPGGDSPEIYIRGNGNPLIIVDGVERSSGGGRTGSKDGAITGFEQMDPNEIESISILKDASSTAVYGVRGANGVIIITTKKGLKGAPKISYSGNFSLNAPSNLPKLTSSYEWLSYMNEANANDGLPARIEDDELERYRTGYDPILYPSIDYNEYVFNKVSPRQQHNINVSGGGDRVSYFVSAGFTDEKGIVKQHAGYGFDPNWNFTRYNFRSNLDFKLTDRLTAGINLESRIEQRQGCTTENESTFFWRMYISLPFDTPGFVDDKYVKLLTAGKEIPILEQIMSNGNYYTDQTTVNSIFKLNYDMGFITKGLSAQAKIGYDTWNFDRYTRKRSYEIYNPKRIDKDTDGDGVMDSYDVALVKANDNIVGPFQITDAAAAKRRNFYLDASVNWARKFKNHDLGAMFLYNQSRNYYAAGTPNDIPRSYMGFVARMTYNYKLKYLAEFNFGMNGSENFPEGKRFGKFPAYSVGWVASEEPFLKNNPVLSYLKIRGSYGKVGSDTGVGRFLYMEETFKNIPSNMVPTPGFGDLNTGWMGAGAIVEGRLANNNVTWQVATKMDVAIEGKLFNNKFSFLVDFFKEKRTNILTTMATTPSFMIPTVGQFGLNIIAPVNYGERSSEGFEIDLGWKQRFRDFNYGISASMTYARVYNDLISETFQYYPWRYSQGLTPGQPWGYICEGFYQSYDEINDPNRPYSSHGNSLVPGDLKYKDINGDLRIDANDKVPIGYPNVPRMNFTLNLDFGYKGFDMSVLFIGADMSTYIPGDEARIMLNGGSSNAFADIIQDRWTPQTASTAKIPILHGGQLQPTGHNVQDSSFWMWDASYIRLKNVQIGYSLPQKFVKGKLGMDGIRVYLSGQNLWTSSDLYIDPEAVSSNNRGILYPVMKTYNVGITLNF